MSDGDSDILFEYINKVRNGEEIPDWAAKTLSEDGYIISGADNTWRLSDKGSAWWHENA